MKPFIKERLENLINERLFSFSRLSIIETCLFQFFLKYVLELDITSSGSQMALNFGKAMHVAIENYAKGDASKIALKKGLEEIEYYPINFEQYIEKFENVKSFIKQGVAMKENIEIEFHFVIEIEDNIKIQGYIDYLESIKGVYRFLDWKTNHRRYDVLDDMQMPLYAFAISELKNTEYVSGALIFLRFNLYNQKKYSLDRRDKLQAKEWALNNSRKALSAMEQALKGVPLEEAFPKQLSSKCSYCPFAAVCLEVERDGMEILI